VRLVGVFRAAIQRQSARAFLIVIAGGVAVRLLALLIFGPDRTASGDPWAYVQMARALLHGDGLMINEPLYGAGLKAYYPPIYPLALAAFTGVLGFSTLTLIFMNSIFEALSAAILSRYDVRAAAIYFLWPTTVLNAVVAQKESLVCLFVVVLAHIAVDYRRELPPRMAAAFGACSALLVLTQPALAFFPIALSILFFAADGRRWGRSAGIAAVFGLLVLLPWWIRNWLIFQRFVPFTTSAGLSLAYVVNGGHVAPPAQLSHLPEAIRFSRVGQLAVRHITEQPVDYISSVMRQVYHAFLGERFAIMRLTSDSPTITEVRILEAANLALATVAVFGRNRLAWRLLFAGLIAVLPTIWFEFGERHRYFLLPFIALLAAEASRRAAAYPHERWRRLRPGRGFREHGCAPLSPTRFH
jgi:4-amino-4-deoxy-L-arabinose transferase-like glycosyltransferase